jgi:hypothetical protein
LLYRRSPKSRFTPRDATDVHRRFQEIVKKAAQNAESKAKEQLAAVKTPVPASGSWRRAGSRPAPKAIRRSGHRVA